MNLNILGYTCGNEEGASRSHIPVDWYTGVHKVFLLFRKVGPLLEMSLKLAAYIRRFMFLLDTVPCFRPMLLAEQNHFLSEIFSVTISIFSSY